MTNAIRGKSYAGNPHVRFDEGEVASAKPRRGSLLYKVKVVSLLAFLGFSFCLGAQVAKAANGPVFNEGSTLTFDVDVATYPESNPYVYGQALPSDITAIVKKGTGSATLGTFDNSSFKGTITVEANGGYLMGDVKAFGAASDVVVGKGGAVEFLETANNSSMAKTHFQIAGAGPDGKGALIRPNANPGTAQAFFSAITLLDDAAIDTSSRWGLQGGTLDMGNHTLTLRTGRTSNYSSFDFSKTVSVKDPGAIVVESGLLSFQLVGSTQPKLIDATGSNGTVSNMTITVKGENTSRIRLMGVAKGSVPCRLITEGTPTLMTYNDPPVDDPTRYSNWDGPVTIGSTALKLMLYNSEPVRPAFVFHNEVSGVGVINHDIIGGLYFTGNTTNTFAGITQNSKGTTYVTEGVHLNITNAVVNIAGGTVAEPSSLVLSDTASIAEIPTPSDRNNRTIYRIGEASGSTMLCGLMRVYDGAVVSNAVTVGYKGYGACYQFGGNMRLIDGRDGNGVIYVGYNRNAYGYLGIDGGTFAQDLWCYLGAYCPGFMVQRGGVANQGVAVAAVPMRIGFSGANSYGCYAVLGGKAVWKKFAALNFRDYTPIAASSVGSFTVDGEGADVDMSESYILSQPATNETGYVTALVNVGHSGKLKVKYIAVEQVPGSKTPSWDLIKEATPRATKTYLNLNGGIIVAAQSGDFFHGGATDIYHLPTRATVYENGFTFDTAGYDVTWSQPLERPYGHGIKSITLPDEALVANVLLGPSRCQIVSSSTGAGADALMDFDNTNRVARGMIVTSPGFGYEVTPTVTVQKSNASSSSTWACAVETTDYDASGFKHGGFTKRGGGTLTVSGANTYGGATRMEGGTLAFTHANGLPSGSTLEFAAAALATSGDDAPLLRAPAYNDGEVCITEVDALDDKQFEKLKTIARFDAPLAAVPSLKLLKSDGSEVTSGAWRLGLSADRKSLRFGANRGLILVVR